MIMKLKFVIKINRAELLFFIAYGIYLIFSIFRVSLFYRYFEGTKYTLIMASCLGFALLSEIFREQKRSKKQLIGVLLVMISYFIVAYANDSFFSSIGLIPIFIYIARKTDYKKIAFFSLIIMSVTLFTVVFAAKIHFIPNIVSGLGSGRKREFLGFRFPLNAPTMAFNITALYIYLREEKINLIDSSVLCLLNTYLFTKTNSKLSYFLSLVLIVLAFVLKYKQRELVKLKALTNVLTYVFIFTFSLSIIIALLYSKNIEFLYELDELVEGRISYANKSLVEYGVTLFGEDIPWIGWGVDANGNKNATTQFEYFYVDNMYIQYMQRYGMIVMMILLAVYTMTLKKARKDNDIYCLAILSIIALRFMIDNLSFQLYYNTFVLMISYKLLYNISLSDKFKEFVSGLYRKKNVFRLK